MSSLNSNRILYADALRIMTTFVVILFHVCTDRWFGCFEDPSEWYVLNFFVSGLRWCVPMFFMLSGMNFLNPERNVSYRKLFTKSIPHLLCALIFWSILYKSLALATNYSLGLKAVTSSSIAEVFTTFLFQPSWFHLWFLYPLIGMYILTPVFRVFTKYAGKKDYLYLLGLYAIFAWGLPLLYKYTGRGLIFNVDGLNAYVGYFVAGYFFAKWDLSRLQKRVLYSLGALSFLLTVGGHFVLTHYAGKSMFQSFFFYQSINIALTSFAVFVLIKDTINNSDKILAKLRESKWLTILSGCSFGIYLSHAVFLNLFTGLLKINTNSFATIVAVPVMAIVVFTLSLGLTLIIKRIPVLNKWII